VIDAKGSELRGKARTDVRPVSGAPSGPDKTVGPWSASCSTEYVRAVRREASGVFDRIVGQYARFPSFCGGFVFAWRA